MKMAEQDPCMLCSHPLPRPSGSACHADPCPACGYPRPLGDCSDLTVGPPLEQQDQQADKPEKK
ncbi:MAG: hypothetical protein COB96_03385 [Planctomycetota bacterium]|nr:MAG: hypothetical protein COB96_03385 [Planctomycetota bacterium]